MNPADYSIFTYLYRDAGNYKAWGDLLLAGRLTEDEALLMRQKFDSGENFIAEQLGIPTLYEALWESCKCDGPSESDHVWHEFQEIRPATIEDLRNLNVWGDAKRLAERIKAIVSWNEKLSSNWPRG
jgi:hypothetical protein